MNLSTSLTVKAKDLGKSLQQFVLETQFKHQDIILNLDNDNVPVSQPGKANP